MKYFLIKKKKLIALELENYSVSYLSEKLLQSGFKNPILKHILGEIQAYIFWKQLENVH